jgi:hypothetical protein
MGIQELGEDQGASPALVLDLEGCYAGPKGRKLHPCLGQLQLEMKL